MRSDRAGSRTPRKALKAWIVRWEWAGEHARVDQPIAALLRPQLGGNNLLRLVETLYAAREYAPIDMLGGLRQPSQNPYRAEWGTVEINLKDQPRLVRWLGEVTCGHNPFLVARIGSVWPSLDKEGDIEWEDDPRPKLTLE